MNVYELPEECVNDPQFVATFTSTVCAEIVKLEEIIADRHCVLGGIKERLTKGLDQRRLLKRMIDSEKKKKTLFEPILHNLSTDITQQEMELAVVVAQLDERSLREKHDVEIFGKIIDEFRRMWLIRQAEYERVMPLAPERHGYRVRLRSAEIELMTSEYKKKELEKIIRQRRSIDGRRLQVQIVQFSSLLVGRWAKQRASEGLIERVVKLQSEVKSLQYQVKRLLQLKKEQELAKLKARQAMPPPKLDMTLIRTLCSSPCQKEVRRSWDTRSSMDSDNISINTTVFEEMCRDDEQDKTFDEVAHEGNTIGRSASTLRVHVPGEDSASTLARALSPEKPANDENQNIEVLEKTYRQLSIEKQSPSSSEVQVASEENPKNSPVVQVKCILRRLMTEKLPGAPDEKKSRYESPEFPKKTSPVEGAEKPRQLPKVQSVETVSRPVVVAAKPLVAEVTPTPSNLFSPHHYALSTCGSCEDLDAAFNTNVDENPDAPGGSKTTNLPVPMNWENFSPPDLTSEVSFASDMSAFKRTDTVGDQPVNQGAFSTGHFLGMFQAGGNKNTFF